MTPLETLTTIFSYPTSLCNLCTDFPSYYRCVLCAPRVTQDTPSQYSITIPQILSTSASLTLDRTGHPTPVGLLLGSGPSHLHTHPDSVSLRYHWNSLMV